MLAAEHDVLCPPGLLLDAANRYRAGFRELVKEGKLQGSHTQRGEDGDDQDGVRFRVVPGVAHHMQNHMQNDEWERGAKELLDWVQRL